MASNGEDMDWGGLANGLAGLYNNYQSYQNANNIGNQVGGAFGQNMGIAGGNLGMLSQQTQLAQQQARDAYTAAQQSVAQQNAGINTDIGTMTNNLTALSDPNSPYMQMARQAIERKDAASGRRSQWGDREVQLAAQLADYVGKYSPGIQSAITNARNQINQNNMGLANVFSTMNNPNATGQNSLLAQLQQQLTGAQGMNTTNRQAQNSANNGLLGLLQNGGKVIGGLGSLFGGGDSGGLGGMLGGLFSSPGGSGWGDGSLFGNSFPALGDFGSLGSGLGGFGYGDLPMGDYFGGGGIGGIPTGWDGGFGGGGGLGSFTDLWD